MLSPFQLALIILSRLKFEAWLVCWPFPELISLRDVRGVFRRKSGLLV